MLRRQGQDSREAALRKYFAKPPDEPSATGAVLLFVLGGLFLLFGLLQLASDSGSSFGLILLLIGLALAGVGWVQFSSLRQDYQAKLGELQPQPSDQQVQAWVYEGMHRLIVHSRLAIGLDQLEGSFSEPLVIRTPILSPTEGVDRRDLLWKKGEDRVFRFGVYRMTIIWLTERHLVAYSCYYDFIRDIPVNEQTDEFHFCDVISLATRETSDSEGHIAAILATGKKATIRQEFIVSVASGEGLRVVLDDARVREITGEEQLPEGAEKAVATIRAMLRNTKKKEAEAGLSSAA